MILQNILVRRIRSKKKKEKISLTHIPIIKKKNSSTPTNYNASGYSVYNNNTIRVRYHLPIVCIDFLLPVETAVVRHQIQLLLHVVEPRRRCRWNRRKTSPAMRSYARPTLNCDAKWTHRTSAWRLLLNPPDDTTGGQPNADIVDVGQHVRR